MIENINEPWNEHLFEEVETFIKDELEKKYDKVCNETEGNIPVFGPDGTLVDSRTNTNDFLKPYGGGVADWKETDDRKAGYIKNKPELKEVALSGSYYDLTNTPNLKPIATSGNYNDLENKPNLSPVAESGSYNDLTNTPKNLSQFTNDAGFLTDANLDSYATKTELTQGLSQKQNTLVSGSNIKTINTKTILGNGDIHIPKGEDGRDAVSPFKGWFDDDDILQERYPNPSIGDYAYVVTEVENIVHIWRCDTNGTWSDSELEFNPANNQEFGSGQALNTVDIIKDFEGDTGFTSDDVLSAKVGHDINTKAMNSYAVEVKVNLQDNSIADSISDSFVSTTYYPSDNDLPGIMPKIDGTDITVTVINLNRFNNPSYVRFNGYGVEEGGGYEGYNVHRIGACFYHSEGENLDVNDDKILTTFTFEEGEHEYMIKVPDNASYFCTTSQYGTTAFPLENFYCYITEGIPFSEPGKYDNNLMPGALSENSISKIIAKLEGLDGIELYPLDYNVNENHPGYWNAVNNTEVSLANKSGSRSTCMNYINVTGYKKVLFLGRLLNASTEHGYAFLDSNKENPVSTCFDYDSSLGNENTKELKIYFANVPEGKTWLATEVGLFNNSPYSFFCYGITGDTISDIVEREIENSTINEDVLKLNRDIYGTSIHTEEYLNTKTAYKTYEDYKTTSTSCFRIGGTYNGKTYNDRWLGGPISTGQWKAVEVKPGEKIHFVINGGGNANVAYIALLKSIPATITGLKMADFYTGSGDKFYGRFKVVDDQGNINTDIVDSGETDVFTLPNIIGQETMYFYFVTKNSTGTTTVDYFLVSEDGSEGLIDELQGVEGRLSRIETEFYSHAGEVDLALDSKSYVKDENGNIQEIRVDWNANHEEDKTLGISSKYPNTWSSNTTLKWEIYKVTPGTVINYKINELKGNTGQLALLYDISDIAKGKTVHYYGGNYTEDERTINFNGLFRITDNGKNDGGSLFPSNSFRLPEAVEGKPDMYLYVVTYSDTYKTFTTKYSGTFYSYEDGVSEKLDELGRDVNRLNNMVSEDYNNDTYYGSEVTKIESVDSIGNTLKPFKYDLYALCDIPKEATTTVPSTGLYLDQNGILHKKTSSSDSISPSTLYYNNGTVYYWNGSDNSEAVGELNDLQSWFFKVITDRRPASGDDKALYFYDGSLYYWNGNETLVVNDISVRYHETLPSVQHLNVSDKAKAYCYVQWKPNGYIPVQIGNVTTDNDTTGKNTRILKKGTLQQGIPYSSTKEISKYIGLSVTMYTFMTAANNPYSLLYTENLNEKANTAGKLFPSTYFQYDSLDTELKNKPASAWGNVYSGKTNCATYFGCVCSEFTAICNGRIIDYATSTQKWLHNYAHKMSEVNIQHNDNAKELFKVGDVLNNLKDGKDSGHCRLVADIERNPDGAQEVTNLWIAESTGFRNQTTSSTDYPYTTPTLASNVDVYRSIDLYKNLDYGKGTLMGRSDYGKFIDVSKIDRFFEFQSESSASGYRYTKLYQNIIDNANVDDFQYNNDICTFAGDRASFATKEAEEGEGYDGDTVVINYNLNNDPDFYNKGYDRIVVKRLKKTEQDNDVERVYYLPDMSTAFYGDPENGKIDTEGFPVTKDNTAPFNPTLPLELPNGWRDNNTAHGYPYDMDYHFLYLDKHLFPGKYEAWVSNSDGSVTSEKTEFEVIDTTFSFIKSEDSDLFELRWDKESPNKAAYIRVVDYQGSACATRELTKEEINHGEIVSDFKKLSKEQNKKSNDEGDDGTAKWTNTNPKYIKLFFVGDYGQAYGSKEFRD